MIVDWQLSATNFKTYLQHLFEFCFVFKHFSAKQKAVIRHSLSAYLSLCAKTTTWHVQVMNHYPSNAYLPRLLLVKGREGKPSQDDSDWNRLKCHFWPFLQHAWFGTQAWALEALARPSRKEADLQPRLSSDVTLCKERFGWYTCLRQIDGLPTTTGQLYIWGNLIAHSVARPT